MNLTQDDIGIYHKDDTEYVVLTLDGKTFSMYTTDGKEVTVTPEDFKSYIKFSTLQSVIDDFKTAKALERNIGTSERIIYIGEKYVYKSSPDRDAKKESVLKEVNRNIYIQLYGLPHAKCYGIICNVENQCFIIEEKLDMDKLSIEVCELLNAFQRLKRFESLFTQYVDAMKHANIGGDFKLDNWGYRGDTPVLTDLGLPDKENPWMPLTWENWEKVAKSEGDIKQFTIFWNRLQYKCSNPSTGGKKKTLRTRSKKLLANRTLRRVNGSGRIL
jgi:hypothetical protein